VIDKRSVSSESGISHRDSSISKQSNESYKVSQIESERVMPIWASIVLCVFFLLDECMEGKVYGFRVVIIEVTKVAEKAEITKVAKMAKIPKRVPGIRMTARHVIWPVTEKAEISIKTARHVMWRSLGGVAV
jgi:hypothetical protein